MVADTDVTTIGEVELASGVYFDGESARPHPVEIESGPGGISARLEDGTSVDWPFEIGRAHV